MLPPDSELYVSRVPSDAQVTTETLARMEAHLSTAARLLPPLGRWRRFDEGRQAKMRAELERILSADSLSKDVYEIASKSLA